MRSRALPRGRERCVAPGERACVALAPDTLGWFATSLKDKGQGLEEPAFWKRCPDQSGATASRAGRGSGSQALGSSGPWPPPPGRGREAGGRISDVTCEAERSHGREDASGSKGGRAQAQGDCGSGREDCPSSERAGGKPRPQGRARIHPVSRVGRAQGGEAENPRGLPGAGSPQG